MKRERESRTANGREQTPMGREEFYKIMDSKIIFNRQRERIFFVADLIRDNSRELAVRK
jgi:hypothetical protein